MRLESGGKGESSIMDCSIWLVMPNNGSTRANAIMGRVALGVKHLVRGIQVLLGMFSWTGRGGVVRAKSPRIACGQRALFLQTAKFTSGGATISFDADQPTVEPDHPHSNEMISSPLIEAWACHTAKSISSFLKSIGTADHHLMVYFHCHPPQAFDQIAT